MKTSRRLFILGIFAAAVLVPAHAAEEFLSEREALGGIKIGQKAAEITAHAGEPDNKGKDTEWEAIGEWVQEWDFKTQGLTLNMASATQGGVKAVLSIAAEAPCKLATVRGIHIGSTMAEVARAYGDVHDKEMSVPGETFVAGSVYGGVIFTFTDGKVSQIFIGAAAE